MNISLRKSNAVQNSINDLIKDLSFDAVAKINEFQDPELEIERLAKNLRVNIARRDALLTALYEIRTKVSTENARVGISAKLATVAHLEKQIQFYNGFISFPVRENAEVIAGKLNKIRNNEGQRSYTMIDDTVCTNVLTSEDLSEFRRLVLTAKKQKQKLQDEILELNVQTVISLSSAAETTLQTEGLL